MVTSLKDGLYNGQIANRVIQVTADPSIIALSINKKNLTHEYIQSSRILAISVICEDAPLSFIGCFGLHSGRDTDKLERTEYKIGETGAPMVLEHAVTSMEARVPQEMSVRTYTIFVGEIIGGEILTTDICMTYDHHHEIKGETTPKAAPSYVSHEATKEK